MFTNKFATRLNSFKSNWKEEKKPSIKDLIEKASKVNGLTHVDLNYPDHGDPSIREISNFSNAYAASVLQKIVIDTTPKTTTKELNKPLLKL